MLGKTLGEIFADGGLTMAGKLKTSLEKNFITKCDQITEKGGTLNHQDMTLMMGLAEAFNHLAARQEQESGK